MAFQRRFLLLFDLILDNMHRPPRLAIIGLQKATRRPQIASKWGTIGKNLIVATYFPNFIWKNMLQTNAHPFQVIIEQNKIQNLDFFMFRFVS